MPNHLSFRAPAARSRSIWGLALLALSLLAGGTLFAARAQAAPAISYPSFASTSGLRLNGSAQQSGAALELTPAKQFQSGTAFSRIQIQPEGSFETEFEFYMHEQSPESIGPADGIAFVLQPESPQAVGQEGGSMGYQGISPSAEVEFDLFQDTYDPSTPNVSFMENGNPEEHLATKPTPFALYDEHVWAWVDYNAATHELSVYVANSATKPGSPLFTYTVNLAAVLNSEYTFAGFTSGTGDGDAIQEVLSWQLSSSLPTRTFEEGGQTQQPGGTPAHGSATSVTCNLIVATASDICTAQVADVDVPTAITPTGQVSFTSASGGSFDLGNTCNLVATPGSPDVASCSVQFLPPSANSLQPSITATYAGDAHHTGSSGHTFYGGAAGLGNAAEIGLTGIYPTSDTTVTVPVTCAFPCSTSGTLMSGPEPGTGTGTSAAFAGAENALAAKAKGKPHGKGKKKAKPVLYGSGSLTLGKPGKGTLTIKLNAKGRAALKHAKGKPIKLVLAVTVKTLNGTLVKTEQQTITVRPAPKKPKGKHGKHHH